MRKDKWYEGSAKTPVQIEHERVMAIVQEAWDTLSNSQKDRFSQAEASTGRFGELLAFLSAAHRIAQQK